MKLYWLLTCEHASNRVPRRYLPLFASQRHFLESHCGYDIGAKDSAQTIANALSWPLICGSTTRLLVDLNRSLGHPSLFSPITRSLDQRTRQVILDRYYHPYRQRVLDLIEEKTASGYCVIHFSCHSFTPVFHSVERRMDLGILYDPTRLLEKHLAHVIRNSLCEETSMKVRLNAPYKGISDGFVASLRRAFSGDQYVGLEIEINQSLYLPIKSPLWQHAWLPRLVEALRLCAGLKRDLVAKRRGSIAFF